MRIIDNEHERVGLWLTEQGAGFWREGTKCIGQEVDGKLTSAVMYDFYNGTSVFAHISVRGYLYREFLWFMFYYSFVQLRCNVIVGLVAEDNFKARHLDERLGFKITGRIPSGQKNCDTLIYSMLKHECRWLTRKNYVKAESASAA